MQIFQETQKSFGWLGISSKLDLFNHRVLRNFIICSTGVSSQWIYLIHVANSAQEFMESIYIVSTCSGISLSSVSTILITEQFIEDVEEFINERMENPASRDICEETNEFVERWSKIEIFIMKYGAVPCLIFPKVIISFIIYFTTDAANDAFMLPYPMWFPFDWRNPAMYLVSVIVEFCFALYPFHYMGCFISLAFGAFMYAITFVKILKDELHSINQMATVKKSRKHMYQKLCEFIPTHANGKQLCLAFSDLYEITLTIVFALVIIAICASMLLVQIELSHDEINSIILLEATIFGSCAVLLLLFVCELGQRFSDTIDEIDETIVTLDWYSFPSEIQRVLTIVLISSQKPVVIKCFGNILCSREQFRKVFKTIHSYFLVLRKFYK